MAGQHWIFEAAGQQRLTWTTKAGAANSVGLPSKIGFAARQRRCIAGAAAESGFDLDLFGFNSPALAIARTQFHARRNPTADQIDIVVERG